MMRKGSDERRVIAIVRGALNALIEHKEILFPYCLIAFVEFFLLEIFYFAPRFPLKIFFEPVIRKIWGEQFLHYPFNLALLPRLFQGAQIPIYIFISTFFVAISMAIIETINNEKHVNIANLIRKNFRQYIHVVVAASISFLVLMGTFKLYELVIHRAELIRSTTGKFYILKRMVIDGAPLVNLVISVAVTALFAYVLPFIIIENKKVFSALAANFKMIWGSFWFIFSVTLIPSLLFIPVIVLRSSSSFSTQPPETGILILMISTVLMITIDAVVYTAITSYFLLRKGA